MEGLKRMFYFRDCVRGIKIPVVIVMSLVSVTVVVMLLGMGVYLRPFTMGLLMLAIWVIFAVILNRLRGDSYYSFEFIPTSAVVGTVMLVITLLVMENAPELFGGGSDVLSQGFYELSSLISSVVSIPLIIFSFVGTYIFGAIGSSIALLFSGESSATASLGGWARGVANDFKGLTEETSSKSPRSATAGQVVPQQRPPSAPSSPAATTPSTALDEGQITARAAWQTATGGNTICCRKCGCKTNIWDANDYCGHCGHIRGISAPEVECIEKCGAKVGKTDKFCFRCGAKQPV